MIPLFFSLLVDTVFVDPDYETVRVHEWGVIQMDYGFYEAVGAEWCFLDDHGRFQSGEQMIVDAPVVWFHGPDFTGTFSVEVLNGSLTIRCPEPDAVEQMHSPMGAGFTAERAVWEGLSFTEYIPGDDKRAVDIPYDRSCGMESFSWAAPWWRQVPSLTVTRASDGWSDQFIYYECTTGDFQMNDEAVYQRNWASLCDGPVLVFAWDRSDNVLTVGALDEDEVVSGDFNTGDFNWVISDNVEQTLCRWAGSNLKSAEIEALWLTWEPIIRGRCEMYGEAVVLFPLPDHVVESISRLNLETDQGYFVEYHRLFLGLTSI